jgi:two-component system LytT family response regulator
LSLAALTMTLRLLVVDDEPLARERITTLLASEKDCAVVGECRDGREAVEAIERLSPDVVFLDVQMPEVDGFEVLREVGVDAVPAVIFVTAYDQYALKAFEVHAVDYLLKPFDRARFQSALGRARAQVAQAQPDAAGAKLLDLLRDLRPQKTAVDRLVVRDSGRIFFLRADEIDWIESCGNYVQLHVGADTHLVRDTMSGMEDKLDGDQFVRIHRKALVNVSRIKELQPLFHGEYAVILSNKTRLTLSRGYKDRLKGLLGEAL